MGRNFVIGDVHGCYHELLELLELLGKIALGSDDRVVFLGDFLDKGPMPLDCFLFARREQEKHPEEIIVVASNHEERHARWWRRERRREQTGEPNRMRPWHDPRDEEVNRQLTIGDVEWIESRPLWVEIVPGWVAVHGGLDPRLPLAKQGKDVLRMRWIRSDTLKHVPVDYDDPFWMPDGCVHWSDRWPGPQSVVYGHEAFGLSQIRMTSRGGLHESREAPAIITLGIDTGCVHGGHLTAVEVREDLTFGVHQVKARQVYLENPGIPR